MRGILISAKEIMFSWISLALLAIHWGLALIFFPVWKIFSVAIHPNNENWITQTLMLLDFPAIVVTNLISEIFQLENLTVTATIAIILISMQWLIVGFFLKVLCDVLFKKMK